MRSAPRLIAKVLTNTLLALGSATLGLYLASPPMEYVKFVGTWYLPIWLVLGVLGGVRLAGSVRRSGELPFFMLPPGQESDLEPGEPKGSPESLLHVVFHPALHIWILSVLAGVVQLTIALADRSTPHRPPFLAASFFMGMVAGALQAAMNLLLPLITLELLRRSR